MGSLPKSSTPELSRAPLAYARRTSDLLLTFARQAATSYRGRMKCVNEAYLNRIATAVPDHDVHSAFVDFAEKLLAESPDSRMRSLFNRMSSRSGIEHRYSILTPNIATSEFFVNAHEFYIRGAFPDTSRRMEIFERFAPVLAQRALDRLNV